MINRLIIQGLQLGKSSTAKSIYWVFSGNIVFIVLTFFTTILIARGVTKAENGIFLALFSFASLFAELGEVGLGSSLSSIVPRLLVEKKDSEAKKYVGTAFAIIVSIGVVLTLLISLLAKPLAVYLFDRTLPVHVIITGAVTLTLILFGFSILTLSAYKRFQEVATLNIFYSLIRLATLTGLLVFAKLTLVNVLLIYLVTSFAAWMYAAFIFKLPLWSGTGSSFQVKNLLKFSSFLALQKIFIAISSRLDVLMLVPLAGAVETGIYGVASRFSLVYPLVVSSLSQVLAPRFAEVDRGRAALPFLKKVGGLVGLLLLSQIIFYIIAEPLITFLVPQYRDAVPVFRGLLLAMTGFVLATPFTTFLIYNLKKPHITVLASFLQLSIIFLANLLLIPNFGRFGPAVSIGVGNVAVLTVSVAATWYYLNHQ